MELTEATLIEASNSAVTALRSLRQAGIQVGLDDFGTGYSSLAYLRQFPLDFVKIDRSFIHDLKVGTAERSIVGAIIGLAHALDLTVVAEGVETDEQQHILEELGCDRAQGFHFARSMSPEQLDAYLHAPAPATRTETNQTVTPGSGTRRATASHNIRSVVSHMRHKRRFSSR